MSRQVVEVLCFEDNPTDSFLVRQNLRGTTVEEFVVTPAERLRDGLTCLQEKAFDIILLDLGLPDSQGLETFRRVYERAQGTPIVVLSGLADETVALKTLQEGSQDYLVKGEISDNVLIRSIRYAIERRRVQQELDRAHAENTLLLNSIPSFLIGVDQAGCVFRWNHLAEATFGLMSKDVVGQPLQQCPIHWNWLEVSKLISAIHESEPAKAEIPFRMQDSKAGILGITLNSIRCESGKRTGFLLIGADISERKFLEEQLRQAQKMESIGRLAAGIAHEINSPTQFVSDNAHFVEKSFSVLKRMLDKYGEILSACQSGRVPADRLADVRATAQEIRLEDLLNEIPIAIREMREGVERIRQIMTSMKVFSHPGTKKQAVNINEAIQSTVVIARNEWKYSADLITEFDSNLPAVECYAGEFNQVILNLIVNAAHAIEDARRAQGKGKGAIKINTHHDENWVEIRISDTGTGIPEGIRHKIFDPFFTTKEIGKGTGQGLALVYAVVVEKHGGTVEVETEMGQGSTFIVRLPLDEKTCELTEAGQ